MIATMTSLNSRSDSDDAVNDTRQIGVADARRRSWKHRGSSQVVFNGPPVAPSSDTDAAKTRTSRSGDVELQAAR